MICEVIIRVKDGEVSSVAVYDGLAYAGGWHGEGFLSFREDALADALNATKGAARLLAVEVAKVEALKELDREEEPQR